MLFEDKTVKPSVRGKKKVDTIVGDFISVQSSPPCFIDLVYHLKGSKLLSTQTSCPQKEPRRWSRTVFTAFKTNHDVPTTLSLSIIYYTSVIAPVFVHHLFIHTSDEFSQAVSAPLISQSVSSYRGMGGIVTAHQLEKRGFEHIQNQH